jgi:acetyl-CoA carboxylase biotin carboxyl carrier protein
VSLTAADVAEIMRLVEQSTFDELTLEVDGIKLNLKRGGAVTSTPSGFASPAHVTPPTPAAAVATVTPAVLDPNTHEVASPLLGTFYRAPKPGAPPFVESGSVVEPDTVIAIIEVMKLMNTVRAGVRGTVTEILVSDGALVEYEQTLMRIRKTG